MLNADRYREFRRSAIVALILLLGIAVRDDTIVPGIFIAVWLGGALRDAYRDRRARLAEVQRVIRAAIADGRRNP